MILQNNNIVLEESLQKKLTALLFELADYNYAETKIGTDPGMFNGCAGLSLFYYHLYQFTEQEHFYEKALQYFQQSYNLIDPNNLSLSHGASGVMWLLNFYSREDAFDADNETSLSQFDQVMKARIHKYSDNIDPMHGLLSVSNYFLSRNNDTATAALQEIFTIIEKKSIAEKDGVAWKGLVSGEETEDTYHYNFGYAHGMLAIIYFLARFRNKGIETAGCDELISKGMEYYLSKMKKQGTTWFPSMVKRDEIRRTGRISYCYGDLGVACGLTVIGKLLQHEGIMQAATTTALNIAEVSIAEIAQVEDIGLCHGASGNGYMFMKLYNTYGEDIFREAAITQYERLLTLKTPGNGVAGFTSLDYDNDLEKYFWKKDPGFINGTTGIGLSIISLLTNDQFTSWDKILYLR